MALRSSPYSEVITLASPGDLTVKIIARGEDGDAEERVALVRVSKAIMMENSDYFRKKLCTCRPDGIPDTIKLKAAYIESAMVWLQLFHQALPNPTSDGQIVVAHFRDMVHINNKYGFDKRMIWGWTRDWMEANFNQVNVDYDCVREMMYPIFSLGDTDAFCTLTRMLVYDTVQDGSGTAVEIRDLPFQVAHLLHLARDSLRRVLHNFLFSKVFSILKGLECSCRSGIICNYMRELVRIRVWPLESALHKFSVRKILDRLLEFDEIKLESVDNKDCACDLRRIDWKGLVMKARETAENNFDGLCLQCMTMPDGGECSIEHGKATRRLSGIFMFSRDKNGQLLEPVRRKRSMP